MSEIERILNLKEKKIKKNLLSRLNSLIKNLLIKHLKTTMNSKNLRKK